MEQSARPSSSVSTGFSAQPVSVPVSRSVFTAAPSIPLRSENPPALVHSRFTPRLAENVRDQRLPIYQQSCCSVNSASFPPSGRPAEGGYDGGRSGVSFPRGVFGRDDTRTTFDFPLVDYNTNPNPNRLILVVSVVSVLP